MHADRTIELKMAGRLAVSMIIVVIVFCIPLASKAAKPAEREYVLKAAFVYNFGKFVDWPSSAFATEQSPLTVCVHGRDALVGMAATLRSKTINGRPIAVVDAHGAGTGRTCHIVYFGDEDPHPEVLHHNSDAGVLTVADSDDFIRAGGMVGLLTVDNKIRFEINLAACRRAGLRISATLLRLARTVVE